MQAWGRTIAGGRVQGQRLQLQVSAALPRQARPQQHHLRTSWPSCGCLARQPPACCMACWARARHMTRFRRVCCAVLWVADAQCACDTATHLRRGQQPQHALLMAAEHEHGPARMLGTDATHPPHGLSERRTSTGVHSTSRCWMAAMKTPGRGCTSPTAQMACSSPAYSTGTSFLHACQRWAPACWDVRVRLGWPPDMAPSQPHSTGAQAAGGLRTVQCMPGAARAPLKPWLALCAAGRATGAACSDVHPCRRQGPRPAYPAGSLGLPAA